MRYTVSKRNVCNLLLNSMPSQELANPSAAVSPGPNSPSHQRKDSGLDDPDSKPSKWQMFLARRRATGSNQSQSVRKKSLRNVVALKKSLLPRNSDDNLGAVMESPPTTAEQNSIDGEECMDAVETVRFATTYGQKESM